MRGVVTHHPAQYLRIETYNYTIKQYWVCCLRKKRAGPGCKNGPHPDPYGLGGGMGEQLCGIITPKKKKLKSVSVSVESVTVVVTDVDGDNNNKSNDKSTNNNDNESMYNDNSESNDNSTNENENIENKNIKKIYNNSSDINKKYSNNDNIDNGSENSDKIKNNNNKYDNNTSHDHKIAGDLRLIDELEEKKKSMNFNIIESETSSSDSSINVKLDDIPSNTISSYFFKNLYYKNTDTETKKVIYDTKNSSKYNSDFMKIDKMKKKEISSLPNSETTEINEIRSKKKVGFDYDSERKKEYFM